MMKEFFTSGLREPAVQGQLIHDQKSAIAAQSLAVVGHLEVTRNFGDRLYGHSSGWNLEFCGNLQFPWEEQNPDSPWKLRLPMIANFITRQDGEWGQLGETFAQVMQNRQDAAVDQQLQTKFAELWSQMAAGTKRAEAVEFLAEYTGCDLDKIENWLKCYAKG